jgi:hypothetical protein
VTPDELLQRINYPLLRQQRATLSQIIDVLDEADQNPAAMEAAVNLTGLRSLIYAIMDVADDAGYMPEDDDLADSA